MTLLKVLSLTLPFLLFAWAEGILDAQHGRRAESQMERQMQGGDAAICDISGGEFNEAGICVVCLNPDLCCELDLQTFGANCPEFCTSAIYQNLQTEPCGSASCASQGLESVCTGSIPFTPDASLEVSFTCGAAGCGSCQATFGGESCTSCEGAAESYDCGNVAGPVRVGEPTEETVSPTANLDRWYVEDSTFQSAVAEKTLAEASREACVPVGAAISDSLGRMRDYIPSDYTSLVGENNMKWNRLLVDADELGVYDFAVADEMVNFAVSNGAVVRGHALVWGRVKGSTYPSVIYDTVENSTDPEATLIDIMTNHINIVAGHFKGRVEVWDVINEHLDSLDQEQNIFLKTLGEDYVKTSFELTRQVLNNGERLVWNEALSTFALDDPKVMRWLDLLQRYKNEGVPVDTIGIQGHSISTLHNFTEIRIFFQAVVEMGYSVELTELDAPITVFMDGAGDPFQAQADYLAEYARTCLELPDGACKGITFWGVDDSITWYDFFFSANAPNLPLLIDENGTRKPVWLSIRKELETVAEGKPETAAEEQNTSNAHRTNVFACIGIMRFTAACFLQF